MKQPAVLLGLTLLLGGACGSCSKEYEFPLLTGPYLGQALPGVEPEIFAPGIISFDGQYEGGAAFSADGSLFAYKRVVPDSSASEQIWVSEHLNGAWTPPRRAPFGGEHTDWDFNFAPFGKVLYFTSTRPMAIDGEAAEPSNIWMTEKTPFGWSEPQPLGHPINIVDNYSGFPSLSSDRTMYFHSEREDGLGEVDIYFARYQGGTYEKAVNVGAPINTEAREFDPCISPDGKYLLFISNRPNELDREYDLYISYFLDDGSWSEPIGLGVLLGIEAGLPNITADGRLFFFVGRPSEAADKQDIYWVDTRIFDSLAPQ